MDTPIMKVPEVLALARKQIEGLREQPEIAEGLRFAVEVLEADLDALLGLDARQERAKKILVILTEQIQKAAFELRDKLTRNIGTAQGRYGKYALELKAVGAKPLKGTHRPPEKQGSGTPPAEEAA